MQKISDIIKKGDHDIWSITPDDSAHDAAKLLVEKDIGALLVVRDGKLVGVVSERDLARKVLPSDKLAHDVKVSDIMSSKVISSDADSTVHECMTMMTNRGIRHLPIMDGEQIVCVISLGDLVTSVITEQKFLIEQLEHYINS